MSCKEDQPQHRLLLWVALLGFPCPLHIHLHQSKQDFQPENKVTNGHEFHGASEAFN